MRGVSGSPVSTGTYQWLNADWPLFGRAEELGFIAETLRRQQRPIALVLAGAAGVGKTRLVREALRLAEAAGYATAWATATQSAATIPFGALAYLIPEPVGKFQSGVALLQTMASVIGRRAAGRTLALAIDDAHLLDAASATLVHQMAANGTAYILFTLRSSEAVPDPIKALWKDGQADYIEVQPLSQSEVGALLERVLGGNVDGASLLKLWNATRGNALYLRELVRGGVERGLLGIAGGVWRWHGPLAPGSWLIDLIDARLSGLGAAERETLEILALAEPLGVAIVSALTPSGSLDALEERGLLDVRSDGRRLQVRLAHPLYAEVVRARTPHLRARGICRQLADALEATGARRRDDLLRLATWRVDSGRRCAARVAP
jgi:predicted ATPase